MRLGLHVYEGDDNLADTAPVRWIEEARQEADSGHRDGVLAHSAYEMLALMRWLRTKQQQATSHAQDRASKGKTQ